MGQGTEQGRALFGHSLGIHLLVGAITACQGGPVPLAGDSSLVRQGAKPCLATQGRYSGYSGGNGSGMKRWGSWLGCTA